MAYISLGKKDNTPWVRVLCDHCDARLVDAPRLCHFDYYSQQAQKWANRLETECDCNPNKGCAQVITKPIWRT
jgi:hypothetical protein